MKYRLAPPRIAIVILNWNGLEDTHRCLQSLLPLLNEDIEIIVVDNGSTGNDATILQETYADIQVLALAKNLGFGQGVHAGYKVAKTLGAEFLLMLNNDARLEQENDTINKLVSALETKPNIGAVAPYIREDAAPFLIQSAGHSFSIWTGYPRMRMAGKRYDASMKFREPTFIVAACLLIRLSVYEKIGGFDPDFFVYSEDFDLGVRLMKAGLREILVPEAFIYHKKAASTRLWSELHIYLMMRSHLIFISKHAKWYHWFTLAPCTFGISLAMGMLGVRSKEPKAFKAVRDAYIDFFSHKWGPVVKP